MESHHCKKCGKNTPHKRLALDSKFGAALDDLSEASLFSKVMLSATFAFVPYAIPATAALIAISSPGRCQICKNTSDDLDE